MALLFYVLLLFAINNSTAEEVNIITATFNCVVYNQQKTITTVKSTQAMKYISGSQNNALLSNFFISRTCIDNAKPIQNDDKIIAIKRGYILYVVTVTWLQYSYNSPNKTGDNNSATDKIQYNTLFFLFICFTFLCDRKLGTSNHTINCKIPCMCRTANSLQCECARSSNQGSCIIINCCPRSWRILRPISTSCIKN